MAPLDPQVAAVLDRPAADPADEDDLIAALEDDPALDAYREQRRQQLHSEFTRAQQLRSSEHGTYATLSDEKTLMDITTATSRVVVHFRQPAFARCRIMDGHLAALAPRHLDARFLAIDVTDAPFLVVKLKVQVLPCVLGFVDGVVAERVVGFEGLGKGSDNFKTQDLESRLVRSGVLVREKTAAEPALRFHNASKARQKAMEEDDDGDDWD